MKQLLNVFQTPTDEPSWPLRVNVHAEGRGTGAQQQAACKDRAEQKPHATAPAGRPARYGKQTSCNPVAHSAGHASGPHRPGVLHAGKLCTHEASCLNILLLAHPSLMLSTWKVR